MTDPGLFDRPRSPRELAERELSYLFPEQRELIAEWSRGATPARRSEIDARLKWIRARIAEIRRTFPDPKPPAPPAPAARRSTARDGKQLATGEKD